ncbi:MAG: hypothetical protein LBQ01_01900 [Prevotellaceae bacterium]|jgi:hypothetical protein|nr:hypothetical protein [Prevotellaceae bacterium]
MNKLLKNLHKLSESGLRDYRDNSENPLILQIPVKIIFIVFIIAFPVEGKACNMAIVIDDDVRANSDTVSGTKNIPLTIDVLANDDYPDACTPELTIIEDSYNNTGVATVSDSKILYTPETGKSGIDSILYQLKCSGDRTSAAKVYLVISNPLSLQYIACPGASMTMGFNAIAGVTYRWYRQDGSTVSNSANTVTVVRGSAADIRTWLVEPRYGRFVFPRCPVNLEEGDNCGTTSPKGCAAVGPVIWKEDFDRYHDGLNPGSPSYGNEPLAPGMTTYTFRSAPFKQARSYALTKDAGEPYWGSALYLQPFNDDHTYPNDRSRGRFFMINGSGNRDQLYRQTISGVCNSTKLYFSFWARGYDALLKWMIFSSSDNSVLATFVPAKLQANADFDETDPWEHYGFMCSVPEGVNSVYFEFFNDNLNTSGNDFSVDDIEVRLCMPPIVTDMTGHDTTVCYGNSLDIAGTYTEDCIFGNSIAFRWEFRHIDSSSWKTLKQENITVDCENVPAITKTLSIASATKADEGHYRMLLSSRANIGSVNCRSTSDSVYVHVVDKYVAPDIRIQVCPSPPNRTVQLSSYLDSTDYSRIQWEQVSPYPVIADTETGLISDMYFRKNATYTYRYTLASPEYSDCGMTAAKVYVHTLTDRIRGKTVDTIMICSSLADSRSINMNQIFGLELGGSWTYPLNANSTVTNNIRTFSASSQYSGAIMFDAQTAYAEADSSYDIIYNGITAKKFDFVYTASCINGEKRVVLIVTE